VQVMMYKAQGAGGRHRVVLYVVSSAGRIAQRASRPRGPPGVHLARSRRRRNKTTPMKWPTKTDASLRGAHPCRARLYVPRAKQSRFHRPLPLLGRFRPAVSGRQDCKLFHRVSVACPGEAALPFSAPAPAALSAWQPPKCRLEFPAEFHQIARDRAGFVVTSYTGVKRRHGGFVVPEDRPTWPLPTSRLSTGGCPG